MKSQKKEVIQPVVTVVEIRLVMSLEEARQLRTLVGSISGGGPLRNMVNEVYDSLGAMGVESYGDFPRSGNTDPFVTRSPGGARLNDAFVLEDE